MIKMKGACILSRMAISAIICLFIIYRNHEKECLDLSQKPTHITFFMNILDRKISKQVK